MNKIIEIMQKERNLNLSLENPEPDVKEPQNGVVPKLKIEPLQGQFDENIIEISNISVAEITQQKDKIEENTNVNLISIHNVLNSILENQEKIMKHLNI